MKPGIMVWTLEVRLPAGTKPSPGWAVEWREHGTGLMVKAEDVRVVGLHAEFAKRAASGNKGGERA